MGVLLVPGRGETAGEYLLLVLAFYLQGRSHHHLCPQGECRTTKDLKVPASRALPRLPNHWGHIQLELSFGSSLPLGSL